MVDNSKFAVSCVTPCVNSCATTSFAPDKFVNVRPSPSHVNHYGGQDNRNNAAWIGDKMIYGDGDGRTFTNVLTHVLLRHLHLINL
jgi:hypothetical protein